MLRHNQSVSRMKKQSLVAKQFNHIFDCMFNERWLAQLLYEYYKQTVIVSGNYNTVRIWDADTGNAIHTLAGHKEYVSHLAVHEGMVISASMDNTIRVWDLLTGELIRTLTGGVYGLDQIIAVRNMIPNSNLEGNPIPNSNLEGNPIPNSNIIITRNGVANVEVWNLSTGEFISTLAKKCYNSRPVATHNNLVALSESHDNYTIRVCDLMTGHLIHILTGHTNRIQSIAMRDNLIVSGSLDKTVRVWDVTTGCLIHTFTFASGVSYARFTDGCDNLIVSKNQDNTVNILDAMTGCQIHTLARGATNVTSLSVGRDNMIMLGISDNTIELWDAETGHQIHILDPTMGHTDWVISIVAHDNMIISHSKDGIIKTWDAVTGGIIHTSTGHEQCTATVLAYSY
jgi:WD40 repeat protein